MEFVIDTSVAVASCLRNEQYRRTAKRMLEGLEAHSSVVPVFFGAKFATCLSLLRGREGSRKDPRSYSWRSFVSLTSWLTSIKSIQMSSCSLETTIWRDTTPNSWRLLSVGMHGS